MSQHKYRIDEILKVTTTKHNVVILGQIAASNYYMVGYILNER